MTRIMQFGPRFNVMYRSSAWGCCALRARHAADETVRVVELDDSGNGYVCEPRPLGGR
jgi:hypothetical protein